LTQFTLELPKTSPRFVQLCLFEKILFVDRAKEIGKSILDGLANEIFALAVKQSLPAIYIILILDGLIAPPPPAQPRLSSKGSVIRPASRPSMISVNNDCALRSLNGREPHRAVLRSRRVNTQRSINP
jgi:hypothetical protein